MTFDKILETKTTQALEDKRSYNRNYQQRLRDSNRQRNLVKRIERDLDFVVGYMHKHHQEAVTGFVDKSVENGPIEFSSWVMLSANEYKTINEAFELSRLDNVLTLEQFSDLFEQHFTLVDGKYIQK